MSNFINGKVYVLILILVNFIAVGALPEYTSKEKDALVKFRELVKDATYKDYMLSDPYLIRWIRAGNFDLDAANQKLRTALKWRRENKIDGILNETIWDFKPPAFFLDGIDYEGSVVLSAYPGRVDLRQHLLSGRRPAAIRYYSRILERIEIGSLEALGVIGNASAPERARPDLVTFLMDLTGYSLRQHACLTCLGVYADWVQQFENYYPEYVKHFIIVNAPRIATPMIQLVKPLMSPPLQKAFKVYGSNRNEWAPILLKIVPSDQLRTNFGGTKSD